MILKNNPVRLEILGMLTYFVPESVLNAGDEIIVKITEMHRICKGIFTTS